jgi:hypothetical protein
MRGPAWGTVSPLCLSTNADKWNGPAGRRDSGQRSKKSNGKGAAQPAAEVWESIAPPSPHASVGAAIQGLPPPFATGRSIPYKVGRRLYSPVSSKFSQ